MFLLLVFCCGTPASCLKVIGGWWWWPTAFLSFFGGFVTDDGLNWDFDRLAKRSRIYKNRIESRDISDVVFVSMSW